MKEEVIVHLGTMGYSRASAEEAISNIEFPEVSMAMEWLLAHPEIETSP